MTYQHSHAAAERENEKLYRKVEVLNGQVEMLLTSLASYNKDLAEHHRRAFKEIDDVE